MKKKELKKIHKDIQDIVRNAKATFFVLPKNKNIEISSDDALFELKTTISDDIGMYFLYK